MKTKVVAVAPFLLKTYMVVDDTACDDVVSWTEDGTGLVVWQPAEFARDLLPTLFKHSNFSSFIRQLNTYGFRKVTTSRWEFRNDMFQKDKKELLGYIRRRRAWTNRRQPSRTAYVQNTDSGAPQTHDEDQRSSSTSFSELNFLVDENKRLKKENDLLSSELKTMKKKCKDLIELVSIYVEENEHAETYDHNKNQLMLFGVRLELREERVRKRKRPTQVSPARLLSQSCK